MSADGSLPAGLPWPVAAATHAAREAIGAAPGGAALWPGMRAFIAWAARTGFDGLDLSDTVVPFDCPAHGGLHELREAVIDHGIRVGALNLLRCSLSDPQYAGENADRVRCAIAACATLGAGLVSISLALPRVVDDCNIYRGLDHSRGSSLLASDADFERTARILRALGEEARCADVRLSIELHHASLADNGAATARLHTLIGDPEIVGVNPDLVNSYWAYATPEEDWREQLVLLAPLANLWHVKNVRRIVIEPERRAEYLGASLGDGDIDYRWAFATMRDAGFTGWISIERGGGGDAFHVMSDSLRYLRNLMTTQDGNSRNAFQR